MKKIFEFNVAIPKYGKQLISMNNANKWWRWGKSKISGEYKNNLKEWYIPTPYIQYQHSKSLFLVFQLHRNNKRILDSDNIGYVIKWTIDAIKETNWLQDDDQIFFTVAPAIYDKKLPESNLDVFVYDEIPECMKELFKKNS